jgi:hypothetical protein
MHQARLWCSITTDTYNRRKVGVTATKKSQPGSQTSEKSPLGRPRGRPERYLFTVRETPEFPVQQHAGVPQRESLDTSGIRAPGGQERAYATDVALPNGASFESTRQRS